MSARAVIDPLFLPDVEIARLVSITPEEWRATAAVLERYGLPRRDPLFKDQRCWPSVRDFLYRRANGANQPPETGIAEDLDALRQTGRRSTRS